MDSQNSRPYAVVQFPDENDTLSVVPKGWLTAAKGKDMFKCKWPLKDVKKAVKRKVDPADNWPEYKAKLIHSSRSFENANKFLQKYQYVSDVDAYTSSSSILYEKKENSSLVKTTEAPVMNQNLPTLQEFNRLEAKVDNLIKHNEEMKKEMEDLHRTVANLRAAKNYEDLDVNVEDFKKLESLEEIKLFDEKLKQDEEFKKGVKRCGCLGGKDHKEAVRRVMQMLFSHEMALQLTWQKSTTKTSIQDFPNIILFISVSVRSNPPFKTISQNEVEDVVKRWLRYASDRHGGRLERLKKKI